MAKSRWWNEPLLHFLILAASLFALHRYWSPAMDAGRPDTIVVSPERIDSLVLMFHRTWQRPPTQDELDGLIDDYIKEEVCYREALKMGLDRDDTLIRRRMRQKLEFLAEDVADLLEPTDDELQAYLNDHADMFHVEATTTFSHIYLNPRQRGDSLQNDAEELLRQLTASAESSTPEDLGDPLLLPYDQRDLRERDIASQFGRLFATQLRDVELSRWSGPIESAYGWHLVFVARRTPGRDPNLDEVRSAVEREWYAARRAASKQDFFDSLLAKYQVQIVQPEVVESRKTAPE